MHLKRRWFLNLFIASLAGLVWFLNSSTFIHAMPPPGGVLWWLLQPSINANIVTVVTQPANAQTVGDIEAMDAPSDLTTYRIMPSVLEGQPLSIITGVWLNGGPINGEGVILDQIVPNKDYTIVAGRPATGNFWGSTPTIHFTYPGLVDGFQTQMSLPRAVSVFGNPGSTLVDRPSQPDMYIITNYNAPLVDADTTFSTWGTFVNGGTYTDSAVANITVRNSHSSVQIKSGDLFVKDGAGIGNKILPTNANGQVLVKETGDLAACSWVDPDIDSSICRAALKTVGNYIFDGETTSNITNAKRELRRNLSKILQEYRGVEIQTAFNSTDIVNFIQRPQTDKWKSKGEVLFVVPPINTVPTGTISNAGADITVVGRKLVVFLNVGNVVWNSAIVYPSGGTTINKFGSISIGGNGLAAAQELKGPEGGSRADVTFSGAFISINLEGNLTSQINVTGVNAPKAIINGLLAADRITITRALRADQIAAGVIAELSYDSSFRRGDLIGLAPFIRPLVSEGTSR